MTEEVSFKKVSFWGETENPKDNLLVIKISVFIVTRFTYGIYSLFFRRSFYLLLVRSNVESVSTLLRSSVLAS